MSQAELDDLHLDELLGRVAPPPPPASDLADRIVARSARTPQLRASRFAVPRRHGMHRHPVLWSTVIAANVLAAAAAAASWDGQQFDFRRLSDLPRRVAIAIHVRHHHFDHEQNARERPRPVAPIRPATGPAGARTAVTPPIRRMSVPAAGVSIPRLPPRPPLGVRTIQRPHDLLRAQTLSTRSVRSFHLHPKGHAHQLVRQVTIAPIDSRAGFLQQSDAGTPQHEAVSQDQPRRDPGIAAQQQAPNAQSTTRRPQNAGGQAEPSAAPAGQRAGNAGRARRPWISRWPKRGRAGGGGRRFGRRF